MTLCYKNCKQSNYVWIAQLLAYVLRTNQCCLCKDDNTAFYSSAIFSFQTLSSLCSLGILSFKKSSHWKLSNGILERKQFKSGAMVTQTSVFCTLARESYKLELKFHGGMCKCPMVYSWYWIPNFLKLLKNQPISEHETSLLFPRIKFKVNIFFSNVHYYCHKYYVLKCFLRATWLYQSNQKAYFWIIMIWKAQLS